jgi:hypothetical protein
MPSRAPPVIAAMICAPASCVRTRAVAAGLKCLRWDEATDDYVRPFPRATLT